jgi:hypothetical protein
MDERLLLKISLATGIVGLAVLYIAAMNAGIPDFDGTEIEKFMGKDVRLSGKAVEIADFEKYTMITMSERKYGNTAYAIAFKRGNGTMDIAAGDELEVVGQVNEFRGRPEVIADRISITKKA